jgi:hypothetical protein
MCFKELTLVICWSRANLKRLQSNETKCKQEVTYNQDENIEKV